MNKRGYPSLQNIILITGIVILSLGIFLNVVAPLYFEEAVYTLGAVLGDTLDEITSYGKGKFPQKCDLKSAQWTSNYQIILTAKEGETINLLVEGTNCEGKILNFKIYNSAGKKIEDLGSSVVQNGRAVKTWEAGNQKKYYFTASKTGLFIKSQALSVTPLTSITCNDGVDNDNDGWIDYLEDPGCTDSEDADELNSVLAICADNLDNDNDGLIDGNDPKCLIWSGSTETAQCQDGIDNNKDGLTDSNDPDCISPNTDYEGELTITQCQDNLDNDLDGLIDWPSDPGCLDLEDKDEYNILCPYRNDLENYATCNYNLAEQNVYSKLPLSQYGLDKRAIVISGYALYNDVNFNEDQVIYATKQQIEEEFEKYINPANPNAEIDKYTSDLAIVNLEGHIHPADAWVRDEQTQTDIINALKLRIEVVDENLPNAKIALYATIRPEGRGINNSYFQSAMEFYKKAGQQGLYDKLDYFSPLLYIRYCNPDGEAFNTYDEMTKQGIEESLTLKKSNGQSLPLAPLLSMGVANTGSLCNDQMADFQNSYDQIKIVQEYSQVEIISYWMANDTYGNLDIEYFLQNVKPVPKGCSCG